MLAAAYQMIAYIRVPVDLLSFSESSFVNDILKFRLGTPIYTPPADNSAYPYMPGAPILTYLIAALLGQPDSIPVYRAVQFAYVILAAIMALSFGTLVLLSVGGVLALTVGANYRNTYDLLGSRAALLVDAMEDSLRSHMNGAENLVDGVAVLHRRFLRRNHVPGKYLLPGGWSKL